MLINQRDSYGRTPLHDACTSGRPESVRHLLKAGADITIVDNNKRTPLHACAEFSDEQKTWTLLARRNEGSGHFLQDRFRPVPQGSPSYQPWYAPRQPTVTSTDQDNPSIGLTVKTLLLAGSDAMATDSLYRTPLDLAIEYDCQEMVQDLQFSAELVQNKWNIEPEDRRLQTVMALKNSSLSTIGLQEPSRQQIFQNPSTYVSFLTFDDVEYMSKHGGNITGVDETKSIPSSGQSLLYVAASKGFTQLVEGFGRLARVNDNPKIVLSRTHELSGDSKYNPPIEYLAPALHVACARELSNMDMIEVLVDKCGVDVNARALVKPEKWAKLEESIEGGTALHILAKANYWWQLDAVKYLLQRGAEIDSINEKGETPFHIACTGTRFEDMNCTNNVYGFWRIECVKILLSLGANPNILDNDGLSCLHKASSSPQIMRILLGHGADLTAGKLSPIFSSIQIQCLETLTILLDAGVSPNVMDHNTGSEGFKFDKFLKDKARWALFCTSFALLHNQLPKDSSPMVKLLIERGANHYAPLDDKETLIHYTFENALYEIVRAFLDCGPKIDFNTRDHRGRTVFLASCDWVECLPGYQHLHWFTKETAPFLRTLEFGANPLVVDNKGRNALHHLLDNPEMEEDAIIQFLAHDAAKTLLHQKDGDGFTPFNCALRFLRPAVVEVLLTMGADLLSPDPTGATALHHIAAQCLSIKPSSRRLCYGRSHRPGYYTGILALWEKFLALGGSINARDNKGSPPLFSYLSSNQRDDYKAPEDSCCHLENFATYFSEEVTNDLDFHAKNENGENALHIIARREKHHYTKPKHDKGLYEFFVGKGLNPLEEDDKGRSSLDTAAACEQKGILELFQYGK
jgi:ankyrin repeat protein